MTDDLDNTPPPQTDWYIKVSDRAALLAALKGPSQTRDTFDDEGNVSGSETVYPHSIISQQQRPNTKLPNIQSHQPTPNAANTINKTGGQNPSNSGDRTVISFKQAT